MDMQRRAHEQRGTYLDGQLTQVEAKLSESIKESGADSETSVVLAEQAEKIRQTIKRFQVVGAVASGWDAVAPLEEKSNTLCFCRVYFIS